MRLIGSISTSCQSKQFQKKHSLSSKTCRLFMCFIICYLTFSEQAAHKQISVKFFYTFWFRVGTANKCDVDPTTWQSKVHPTIRTWIQNDSYASKKHGMEEIPSSGWKPKIKTVTMDLFGFSSKWSQNPCKFRKQRNIKLEKKTTTL